MAAKRETIITAVSAQLGHTLIKRTRATYWDSSKIHRAVCTLSKRYTTDASIPYWFAYHHGWDELLGGVADSVVVLGAMDLSVCFAVPHHLFQSRLPELNTTENADGSIYWHVKILEQESGVFALQMPKTGKHMPLNGYTVPVATR